METMLAACGPSTLSFSWCLSAGMECAVIVARSGGRAWGSFAAAGLRALAMCVRLWAAVSWIRISHL